MNSSRSPIWAAVLLLVLTSTAHAGIFDRLFGKKSDDESAEVSQQDADSGLKAALAQGVEFAIERLGKTDGFLGDEVVKIGVPDQLESLAKAAKKLGGKKYVKEFETTMNRAAEAAVPITADVFGEAIRAMTLEDALAIVRGPDDAATQYFRNTSGEVLAEKVLPIVADATQKTGVTKSYKSLEDRAGGILGKFMDTEDADLDQYITDKALDGLFYYIAVEEKKIRNDPVARTTDILQRVFGGG